MKKTAAPRRIVAPGQSRMSQRTAGIWVTVITFPQMLAATEIPRLEAKTRKIVIKTSRPRIKKTTQPLTLSKCQRLIKAAPIKILSARGSRNFPNVVTSRRVRAKYPSRPSVRQARIKTPAAKYCLYGIDKKRKPTVTGVKRILNHVKKFAKFISSPG